MTDEASAHSIPHEELELKKRRRRTIVITSVLFTLLIVSTLVEVRLLDKQSFLLLSLLNLNIILLLLLLVLIFRNVVKVYMERRSQKLGAKFRTKLLVVFVGMALVPTSLLFIVASNLISESLDNWFNPRLDLFLSNAMSTTHQFTTFLQETSVIYSRLLADQLEEADFHPSSEANHLQRVLTEYRTTYSLASLQVFDLDGKELGSVVAEGVTRENLAPPVVSNLRHAQRGESFLTIEAEKLIRCGVPLFLKDADVSPIGSVFLGFSFSGDLITKMMNLSADYQGFQIQHQLLFETKVLHITILVIITLTIVFSATWLGFYIARSITIPIERLAEATREVASGNLNFLIDVKGYDDVGILIDSFNQMTTDLQKNKAVIESAHERLKQTNLELASQTAYIETILQNINAGVLAMDREGIFRTINKAATNILQLPAELIIARHFLRALEQDPLAPLLTLVNRAFRTKHQTTQRYISINDAKQVKHLAVSCTPLLDQDQQFEGLLVVLEDMTELLHSQRIAAWQEVARRIAHEIKNPLTPIRLSAERLQKRFSTLPEDQLGLLTQLTQTIVQETEGLKKLVNEFSQFARMPAAELRSGQIYAAIEDAISLYAHISDRLTITVKFDEHVPVMNFDREQIKRVFINLLDNAIAAMNGQGTITITSHYDRILEILSIEVADEGIGIPIEDRERLFLPYFSTKTDGGGLGLAIVNRIITDHRGFIRIRTNHPRGTKFVIELPATKRRGVFSGL